MKQILVMMAAVVLVGCGDGARKAAPKKAPSAEEKAISIADPIVEKAVREQLVKPEGELTNADLEKVTDLSLDFTEITDEGLKELAKLQKLKSLRLNDTEISDKGLKEVSKLKKLEKLDLNFTQVTDNGAAELQKALPNCRISAPNPPRETP